MIATNNPNIDIPKVVDEVEKLAEEFATTINNVSHPIGTIKCLLSYNGFEKGYKKSQETHHFSEEDMIEFADWVYRSQFDSEGYTQDKETKELLQLWKEQKPKTIYYE